MKEILVLIGGALCIGWALFHLLLWKIFDWKNSLRSLSHQQRSIMYIANIMIAYMLLAFAYVSIAQRSILISSSLGAAVLCGIGVFWLIRAALQAFFGFREKEAVRRSMAIIITCIIMALLYLAPLLT
jgi:hypothetical protein